MIDARLAEQQTDGWRYDDMPEDGQAWRDTLALPRRRRPRPRSATASRALPGGPAGALIQAVQDLGADDWHGLPAEHVWSLWTRYACTAFYSHPCGLGRDRLPRAAYPRGYKNPGVDRARAVRGAPTPGPADDPVPDGR